jgi:hypothetical protein
MHNVHTKFCENRSADSIFERGDTGTHVQHGGLVSLLSPLRNERGL